MKIECFTLCQSAKSIGDGVFEIHDPIREIVVNRLPATSEPCTLPIGVTFERRELGQHKIGFAITGPDGSEVYDRYQASMKVNATPGKSSSGVGLNFQNLILKLSRPGQHTATLTVDGKNVAIWKFNVGLLQ